MPSMNAMDIECIASSPTDSTTSTCIESYESNTIEECIEKTTRNKPFEYQVELNKDIYGLGIYFVHDGNHAIVDQHIPFYKLPSGHSGPGESSGLIKPGDILTHINEISIEMEIFQDVVETLRKLPLGIVKLHFKTPNYYNLMEDEPCSESIQEHLVNLQEELKRERKCRQLVEKRLDMYRHEVLRLNETNIKLRCQIKKSNDDFNAMKKFLLKTQLSI